MKPTTRIAIAGLLSAAGAVLSAFAAEFDGATPQAEPTGDQGAAPTTGGKRGPKKAAAAPVAESSPETAAPTQEATSQAEPEKAVLPTEEQYEKLRGIIKPFVEGGQGAAVKSIIAKYSANGLKEMDPKHHAAFEKDMAALSY